MGAPRFRDAFPDRLIGAFDGSASATKSASRQGRGQGILRFLLCILGNLKIETLFMLMGDLGACFLVCPFDCGRYLDDVPR
jgi:hypothetical protein